MSPKVLAAIIATVVFCQATTATAAITSRGLSAEPTRDGWHETVLYRFRGPEDAPHGDGAFPQGGVIADASGALYGTTSVGGSQGNGTVFELTPSPSGDPWQETVLHEFQNAGDDGASPVDRPVLGADGVLYGTTQAGGQYCHGVFCVGGTVFALIPPPVSTGPWAEQVLVSFSDQNPDGDAPHGDLFGGSRALFGTTALTRFGNAGTAFQLVPGPSGATETTLHAFSSRHARDGVFPEGGLVADRGGVLFGTTLGGGNTGGQCGNDGCGLVYELIPPLGHDAHWTEHVLYAFTGPDGSAPFASLLLGRDGALYGTTYGGGLRVCQGGCGVAFKLTQPHTRAAMWTETIVHQFGDGPGDGTSPVSPLIADRDGVLFGTTLNGGDLDCGDGTGCGAVFALRPRRDGSDTWSERILHQFRGLRRRDGQGPAAGLLLDGEHRLFGTTEIGGGGRCYNGCGTVFSITQSPTRR
jgi:uncharacterized repeat protein (TIGR03803 family)